MNDLGPDTVSNSFDVRIIIAVLIRNTWIIMASVAVSLLTAIIFLVLSTAEYTSSTVLLVDPRQEQILDADKVIASNPGLDSPFVDSEAELMKSAEVAERVIRKLDLQNSGEFAEKLGIIGSLKRLLLLGFLENNDNRNKESEDAKLRKIIDAFHQNLSVRRRGLSYVIDVNYTSTSPERAALIANEIANAYLDDQLDAKYASTKRARAWLSTRLEQLQGSVEKAELDVESYRIEKNLINIAGGENPYDKQLAETNIQLIAARAEVVERKLKMERRNPSSELKKDYDSALSRQKTLETAFEKLAVESAERERDAIKLRELERQAAAGKNLYETFLGRYKEVSAQQSLQSADSRIISRALPPSNPSFPKKSWVLFIAMVVGVGTGTTFSLLKEHLDDGIRTAEDVTAQLGSDCLALVPELSKKNLVNVQTTNSIAMMNEDMMPYLDSMRAIFRSFDKGQVEASSSLNKLVTVTSSEPNEGKTTIAIAIARYGALTGMKTLIIDADLRTASASQRLGFKDGTSGLIEILTKNIPWQQSVSSMPNEPNLDVLCADRCIPNAAELFSSQRMKQLIAMLGKKYDLIIIDTAPMSQAFETRQLVQMADKLVFVSLWGLTSSKLVKTTLDALGSKKNNLVGIVLNRVNFKKLRLYTAYSANGNYYQV